MQKSKTKDQKEWTAHVITILAWLVIIVGIWLRLYNLNWDQSYGFHPDERNVVGAALRIGWDDLNPHFFAYNGLPVYLMRAAYEGAKLVTDEPSIWVVGRAVGALASIVTIYVSGLLAAAIFSPRARLLSAALVAGTVGLVQQAHFLTPENLLVLFGMLATLGAVRLAREPQPRHLALWALGAGLALATKLNGAVFWLGAPLALLLNPTLGRNAWRQWLPRLAWAALLAAGVAFAASPYTLLDWHAASAALYYEQGVVTRSIPVVYTLQFVGTLPYLYQFWQMGMWLLGPPVAVVVFGAMGWALWVTIRRTQPALAVATITSTALFLIIGSWFTKFIRYNIPIIALWLVVAAGVLVLLMGARRKASRTIWTVVTGGVLIWQLWYLGAFSAVYRIPHPWIRATTWMESNLPEGAQVVQEEWDVNLPVTLPQVNLEAVPVDIYGEETPQKIERLATALAQSDAVALSSRRLWGTVPRLPQYPYMARYYQLLWSGALGFEEVARFNTPLRFLALTWPVHGSEETFEVYDHPETRIFINRAQWNAREIAGKILELEETD